MPLPFLTAQPDGDTATPTKKTAADTIAALLASEDLYEDHRRWRRPYHPGPLRVGSAALLLLLAAYLLVSGVIIAAAGALPGAGVCFAIAAVLITVAVRTVRTGIWVSPQGLRQRRVLRGVTLPWAEVAEVRTVQQPVRVVGTPRTAQGQALVVRRTDGTALPVLVTDRSADFVGRPQAFAMAADAVEERVAEFTA
ncbi:PH domain-containing protein [Streptomyces sp. UNOB3_S3]|uniref:PH domain-containing protein n=1 Tax=Streptomyces sp. UNOB3_S3 TaxID=2871682 RepID=UPI001E34E3CD|nr:PH domain-containing protein [Streptomyces sp. UNOB3_S3]MCC3774970.1 PH domain-containing protein [Streptomyces sp. UNOB3_S3]